MHTLRLDGFDDFLRCHHEMLLLFDAARLFSWLCSVFLPPRLLFLPYWIICAHLAANTFIVIWKASKIHTRIFRELFRNPACLETEKNSIASRMNRTLNQTHIAIESSLNTIIFGTATMRRTNSGANKPINQNLSQWRIYWHTNSFQGTERRVVPIPSHTALLANFFNRRSILYSILVPFKKEDKKNEEGQIYIFPAPNITKESLFC